MTEAGKFENLCASHSSIPTEIQSSDSFDIQYTDIEKKELLGMGGFAQVYEARVETDDGTYQVAVKEPRFPDDTDSDVAETFSNEAEIWSHLNHDHIVPVVDWGTTPHPWIALEYAAGGTLADYIEKQRVSLEERLWIAICLCKAVRYAHKRGVMHFDLKPDNILFHEAGQDSWAVPKITDWGLARMLLTHGGDVDGLSFHYAAPEQLRPEEYEGTDEYTDIYQMGAVLYALLTGTPPVDGNKREIADQILKGDIPAPTTVNSSLPKPVDRILLKALRADWRERYEDMLLFQRSLQALFVDVAAIPNTRMPRADIRRSGVVSADGPISEASLQWKVSGQFLPAGPPAVVGDLIYLTTRQGTLHVFSVHTGEAHWGTKLSDNRLTAPVVADDELYVADSEGNATIIDLSDRTVVSQTKIDGRIRAVPLQYQDTLLLMTVAGDIYALDSPDVISWHTRVRGKIHAPAAARNELLLVSTSEGLVAINSESGDLVWDYNMNGTNRSPPAIFGETVYTGGRDAVSAIDIQSGDERWTVDSDAKVTGVSAAPERVYASTAGGSLQALDPESGEEIWRFERPNLAMTSPVVGDTSVFVGCSAAARKSLPARMDDVYALKADSGQTRWTYATDTEVEYNPVITGKCLLVTDSEGSIYSLK